MIRLKFKQFAGALPRIPPPHVGLLGVFKSHLLSFESLVLKEQFSRCGDGERREIIGLSNASGERYCRLFEAISVGLVHPAVNDLFSEDMTDVLGNFGPVSGFALLFSLFVHIIILQARACGIHPRRSIVPSPLLPSHFHSLFLPPLPLFSFLTPPNNYFTPPFHFSIILEYRTIFQMKQRRSKPTHPKKVTLFTSDPNQSHPSTIANKLPSTHTKMSTNYTVHSNTQNPPQEIAAKKSKKGNLRNSKESPITGDRELPKSKSVKKFKINLDSSPILQQNTPQISYRQYCLVDENFVPVTTPIQQKKIEDFLAQTAPSTCDFNFNFNYKQDGRKELRKRAISTLKTQDNTIKVEKIDISTSVHEEKREVASKEISVTPEYVEIGLQYSERREDFKDIGQEQCTSIIPSSESTAQSESLSQLLFKLQFSHLPDEKSFSSLTSNEKEHFSQLLESLVSKLKPKPQIKPIDFSPSQSFPESLPSPCETYKHPYEQQSDLQLQAVYQQLQKLVCMREYSQMNWIQSNPLEQHQDHVNTSLFSVINFLCHLFCYVEVQYSDEFIYMIQKVYGLTFREKYKIITRRIKIDPKPKFRVVEQAAFLDFINQSNAYSNTNELVHYKAIFDAFNEHLEEYRPFYLGNGEQFPWAIRMFTSMSEYSINEDSLQIIFQQAKDKMIEWCGHLCGMLVDLPSGKFKEKGPLELKRAEREERMVRNWLKEENFEKDGIELYSTQVLHDISEDIYQQLLQELLTQMIIF